MKKFFKSFKKGFSFNVLQFWYSSNKRERGLHFEVLELNGRCLFKVQIKNYAGSVIEIFGFQFWTHIFDKEVK